MPEKKYNENLEMIMEQEEMLQQRGISGAAIEAGKQDPYGFVAEIDNRNYFITKKVRSYELPRQFGDR